MISANERSLLDSVGGLPLPIFDGGNEDCLFLDVTVPSKAVKNPNLKLPVMVYFYGGAYVFGSKDSMKPDLPFYDGSGIIGRSNNNMIYVTFNYRLGAFGFLAGTTMEKEGLPNAGLWDQRAALKWIQDYIHLLGGDPNHVTAMGESAGAGSIIHHLVAEGGTKDPLFSRAILLSPAYEYMWDRAGIVEDNFQKFAALADCKGQGLACLRSASASALEYANRELGSQQYPGTFAVGPTPDGTFIRQLPVLELRSGNFYPIESMILSHVEDEALLFVSGSVVTNADFDEYVDIIFPNYTAQWGINRSISTYYPPVTSSWSSKFWSQSARVNALLRDSSFVCNVRHLAEAYGTSRVWSMQYSVSPGWHGTDLFAVFYNPRFTSSSWRLSLGMFLMPVFGWMVAGISNALQSYLASYVVHGDPNTSRLLWNLPPTVSWSHPNLRKNAMTGVVNVGNWGFGTITDSQADGDPCDFWADVAAAATLSGGYFPPGLVINQTRFFLGDSDPHENWVGGNA